MSYFVGGKNFTGGYDEDGGFAINGGEGWSEVVFTNHAVTLLVLLPSPWGHTTLRMQQLVQL